MNELKKIFASMEGNRIGERDRWFFQNHLRMLATGQETGGQYFISELSAPVGDEPPLHLHLHEEEAFYVLEGQMTVWVGKEDPIVLNVGDYAIMPRNIPHTYQVTSDTEARFITVVSPAGFEEFVREVSVPAEEPTLPTNFAPPTPERFQEIIDIGDKHGVKILAPPGNRPADFMD